MAKAASSATLFEVKKCSVDFKDYPGLAQMLSDSQRDVMLTKEIPVAMIITGPKGCGKSALAEAIVGNLKIPFIRVEVCTIPCDEHEKNMFVDDLLKKAGLFSPCAVIIEDILCKPHAVSSTEDFLLRKDIVTLFRELNKMKRQVWIIATALSITCVEVLIGKYNFPMVVEMRLPDHLAKIRIFDSMVKQLCVNLEPELNSQQIVLDTPTYVAGDLKALVVKAAVMAKWKAFEERRLAGELLFSTGDVDAFERYVMAGNLNDVLVTAGDFQLAVKEITPAARCGPFFPVDRPNVKWDEDVCCPESLRQELEHDFLLRVRRSQLYESNLTVSGEQSRRPTGIILHGPPGCGKTLIAKAMATEAGMNFLFVNGSELLRMSDCEGDHVVQLLFEQARHASPCVVFLEDIDFLCQKNDFYTEVGIVSQLLPILDEVNDRGNVYVIAATHHPDRLDPALVLAGRFDKHHYVGLPNAELRHKILLVRTKNTVLASDVNLEWLATDVRCENLSGADLDLLIHEAVDSHMILCDGDTSEGAIFNSDIQKALRSLVEYRPR